MYILNVYYHTKNGERENFLSAIKKEKINELCKQENGNIMYDYYFSDKDPNELLLVEKWESRDAQKSHCETSHAKRLQEIKALFVERTELEAFEK